MNFPFTLLFALAATLTLASPVPKKFLGLFDIPTTFIKYQAPKPVGVDKIGKVDCMGQQLSEQAVKTSFTYLTGYANMQAKRPKDEKTGTVYPNQIDPTTSDNSKVLEALTQWKGCEPYQKFTAYVEFPVNADETGYKGGDAGSDKIIALAQEDMVPYSKMTYCGVFSNRQQDGKVFAPCKPSA